MWYSSVLGRNFPFFEFDRMRQEIDTLFNMGLSRPNIRNSVEVFPPISIAETTEDVRVYAFAPGFEKRDFDVSIQGNLLTISGKRSEPKEVGEKWICHRQERPWGEFTRMINLNQSIDSSQVHANYENGVMSVFIGRKSESKPRKIEIKSK